MRRLFEIHETVKYGAILAGLVAIMSSAIYGSLNVFFQEYGLPIAVLAIIAIYFTLERFKKRIGIFLSEMALEIRNKEIKKIHTNFERKIREVFSVEDSKIIFSTKEGEFIEMGIVLLFISLFLKIGMYLNDFLPIEEVPKRIVMISYFFCVFFFVFLGFLMNYMPRKLSQYFDYVATISLKTASSWENCYVVIDTKENRITIKYYDLEEYMQIIKILQESGFSYTDNWPFLYR